MLDRFERQTVAAGVQSLVTATGFQSEVTAARPRVNTIERETVACPLFKLLDRDGAQGQRAGTETSQRGLGINPGNLSCQRKHALCQFN